MLDPPMVGSNDATARIYSQSSIGILRHWAVVFCKLHAVITKKL